MNKYDLLMWPNNHLDAALQALNLNLQVFFTFSRTTFTFIHLLAKNQFPQISENSYNYISSVFWTFLQYNTETNVLFLYIKSKSDN